MNFEKIVGDACEDLPAWVQELLEESGIAIYVRDKPPAAVVEEFGHGVRGLFTGRKYSADQSNQPTSEPTRIEIYRAPILEATPGDEKRIKQQVRRTVVHEVGHYLGMSEEEIRRKGY